MEQYSIKVEGHISAKRLSQSEDVAVMLQEDGSTLILYSACDQARLHSILVKIRDLGLTLLEVRKIPETKGQS